MNKLTIIVIIFMRVGTGFLSGYSKDNNRENKIIGNDAEKLLGLWRTETSMFWRYLEFKSNSVLIYTEADGLNTTGYYIIENNNKITLKFNYPGEPVMGIYYFSFSNNYNTLTLTEVSSQSSIEYVRQ